MLLATKALCIFHKITHGEIYLSRDWSVHKALDTKQDPTTKMRHVDLIRVTADSLPGYQSKYILNMYERTRMRYLATHFL